MTRAKTFAALVERITPGPFVAANPHGPWRVETDAPGYPNDGWVPVSELLGPDAEANAEFIAFCFTHASEIAEMLGERERIVAWLRSQAKNDRESGVETALIMAMVCEIIANAIEAGTHKGDE